MKHYTFSRAIKNTSVFLGALWTVIIALAWLGALWFCVLIFHQWAIGR